VLIQVSVYQQIISTISALILFSSFILLTQKSLFGSINIFAFQSFLLFLATLLQAVILHENSMYFSAVITLVLKVISIPWLLYYFVGRLRIHQDKIVPKHPFLILLGALFLVVYCYHIIVPITLFSSLMEKHIVVVALSVILLGMLLMIVRRNAIIYVLGFMVMENGLFFSALMSTQGMPMIVELGVAFDLLIAVILFGVFFFHIRTSIETMDVDSLNHLREDLE